MIFIDRSNLVKINEVQIGKINTINLRVKKYNLSCQVSLEEYMACAVGGCAGCTVLIKTENGNEMKRVCVDGPVFEAKNVIQFQK